MSMADVFEAVRAERAAQDAKWGPSNVMRTGSDADRHLVLSEEVGEVAKAALEKAPGDLRAELVQVAATAVLWLQLLDARAEHARVTAGLRTFCRHCLEEVEAVDGDGRCAGCVARGNRVILGECIDGGGEGCDHPHCPNGCGWA